MSTSNQEVFMRVFSLFLASLLCVFLTGCGGDGTDTQVSTTSVSKGQELMDLQAARNSGVITPQEYESQKSKILER
jgi:hypothetical protein